MKKSLAMFVMLGFVLLGSIGCNGVNPPVAPAVPTAVPTPPPVWNFEGTGSGSVQGWSTAWGGANAPANSVAVASPGFESNFGLGLVFNGTAGDTDLQAWTNASSQGFPLNFTNLNASGVTCLIYLPASAYTGGNGQYNVAFCPFIFTAPVTVAAVAVSQFGGCYNGWKNQNAQYGPNGSGGNWALSALTPADATYWPNAKNDVVAIGVEVNLSNSVATKPIIDDVAIY